jgi:predicted transcriptional regulator
VLWRSFQGDAGVSRREFFDYFGESVEGVALVLSDAVRLRSPLSLEELREVDSSFQPPQFFKRLRVGDLLWQTVVAAL